MKLTKHAESCRVTSGPMTSDSSDGCNGAFHVPYECGVLMCIVSDGAEWDHVSVRRVIDAKQDQVRPDENCRTPTWNELQYVRSLFFAPDEWVLQFSPPASHHINTHNNVLHLWRPQQEPIPIPPEWMV